MEKERTAKMKSLLKKEVCSKERVKSAEKQLWHVQSLIEKQKIKEKQKTAKSRKQNISISDNALIWFCDNLWTANKTEAVETLITHPVRYYSDGDHPVVSAGVMISVYNRTIMRIAKLEKPYGE